MAQNNVLIRIAGDITDLRQKMSSAQKVVVDFSEEMKSVGKKMTLGISLPIAGLGAAAVKVATDFDSLKRGLAAVAGSAFGAEKQFVRLKEVAKLPGLGLEEAVQGSINLQAAGFSAQLAERSLKAFGNALATVGKGKAELDGVILALGQIASKGKISAEEINQIAERVPQIRKAMQAAFGTSDTELLQKAGLDAEAFVTRVVAELEKLPPVAGGAQNAFENMADALKQAGNAIGQQLLPLVISATEWIGRLADQVVHLNPEAVRWGVALAGVSALIGPLVVGLSNLGAALALISTSLKIGLLPLLGKAGLVIAGLTALSTWLLKTKLDAAAAAGEIDRLKTSLRDLSRAELQTQINLKKTQLEVGTERNTLTAPQKLKLTIQIAELEQQLKRTPTTPPPASPPPTLPVDPEEAAKRLKKAMDEAFDRVRMRGGLPSASLTMGDPGAYLRNLKNQRDGLYYDPAKGQFRSGTLEGRNHGMWRSQMSIAPRAEGVSLAQRASAAFGLARQGRLGDAAGAMGGPKIAGDALGKLAGSAKSVLSAFNPLGMVATVFGAALESLAPTLEPLTNIIGNVGSILAKAFLPILQSMWPVFKQVVIAATWVGQIFFTVAGGIAKAMGWLIKAIGTVVDKLLPGRQDGLKKAGQGLIDIGNGFSDAAKGLKQAREEIKDLSWEDATKPLHDAAREASYNVSEAFDLAYRRNQVAGGMVSSALPSGAGNRGNVDARVTFEPGSVLIQAAPGDDGEDLWQKFTRVLVEKRALGGTSDLDLAILGVR